ncbi:glycosyltransferase [bacterium]|nr:glycosyltransferase [bacterium]
METVSIIMPAHNEGPRIYENIKRVNTLARDWLQNEWKTIVCSFEIIVIDDGSTDETWQQIQNAEKEMFEVKGFNLEKNAGKGLALRYGYKKCKGSWVFFIDSDLDIAPEYMIEMTEMLTEKNVDAIMGSKQLHKTKTNYPWYRRLISTTYTTFVHLLIPLPVKDTQTGFKLFKKAVLDNVIPRMLVRRYALDIEILSIAYRFGFEFAQCPVEVSFSDKRGSVTVGNIYNMLVDTLAVFYRLRIIKYYDSWKPKDYSYQPMISIVIAVKNDNPYLQQSVRESLKQKYEKFEIIVLPDENIDTLPSEVSVIPTGNELPAIKRNMGVEAAKGEIIAFLDDDSYPAPNWLHELAANFDDDEVGAAGGPATTPSEDTHWLQVSGAVYSSFAASGSYRYRYIHDRRREVDDYPTCNLAVRKSVFNKANGFQTNYWPGEDTELCLTLTKKLGKKIIYDPLVHVYHHRRSFWNGHFKQVTQYALHRGFFVKKFPETSRKPAYFMPTILTFGILTGWTTYFWCKPLFYIYLAVMTIYFIALAAASLLASPKLILYTIMGTFLTHIAYGIYFMKGLFSSKLKKEEEYHDKLKKME